MLEDRFYTRQQAARLLGISLSSVIRAEARGTLRFVRLGKRPLIAKSEIERALKPSPSRAA